MTHSGSLGGGFDLNTVDQWHIDNLEGVVFFFHDHTAAIPRDGNEIGVRHVKRTPVSQLQDERPKRLLVKKFLNRKGIHTAILEEVGGRVKRPRNSLQFQP